MVGRCAEHKVSPDMRVKAIVVKLGYELAVIMSRRSIASQSHVTVAESARGPITT